MEISANFDWDETRGKKLVVFMPNYKWSALTEFSIRQIKTVVDKKDYLIIIGNDNTPQNWNYLWDLNVRAFTIMRDSNAPRNGCFIRNYFLRRCQSELVMQKDGEVVVTGDFIYRIINLHLPWRAGNIYVTTQEQCEAVMKTANFNNILSSKPTRVVEPTIAENSYHIKEIIELADGRVNPSSYFHYAFACKTDVFPYIGGYDEDYTSYGWEDSDMFIRLFHIGTHLVPDSCCSAIHLWHPRATDSGVKQVTNMRQVFVNKSPADYFRNKAKEWGTGE